MPHVEITPLTLAHVELPDFHPQAPGSCEVLAFLVRDGDLRVLVDTGVGSGDILIDRLYKPQRIELSTALSSAGVSLEEIGAVVNSHLHFDHCGNNRLFPGVPIYVQELEFEAALRAPYTVLDWVEFPGARYEVVSGPRQLSPRIELVPTPGHAPGHQSVVVRSDTGIDLIVAQAAYTASEFESSRSAGADVPEGTWSPPSYRGSLALLHQFGPRRAFFSHDLTIWCA